MVRVIVAAAALVAVGVLLVLPFHPEAPILALLSGVTPHTTIAPRLDWILVESGGNFVVFALVGLRLCCSPTRHRRAAGLSTERGRGVSAVQLLIPSRVASWTDFVTNCVGTATGVAIAAVFRPAAGRRRRDDRSGTAG